MLSLVCIPTVASCTCTWIWCEKNGSLSTQTALPASFTVPCNAIYTENDDAAFLASKVRSSKRRSKASLSTASARTWAPEKLQIFLLQGHFLSSTEKFSDIEERRKLSHRSSLPSLSPLSLTCLLSQFGYRYRRSTSPLSYVGKIGEKKSCWKVGKYSTLACFRPFC